MYILRHPKGGLAPLSISRAPGRPGDGELSSIATDGTHGSILRDGGDCIVVHVGKAPVELLVTAFLAKEGDQVPALRLDQIGLDAPAAPSAPVKPVAPAPAAPPPAIPPKPAARAAIQIGAHGISLIGHVERSGDLVAAPGEYLGDPSSSLRLEGFQAMWPDRPAGVDLAYGIVIEGVGHMPIVKTGKFCGSKGEARRITEATFALVGPDAGQFQLQGTAYFSGGFQLAIQSGVPLSGPSGLEHLTALSLRAVASSAPQTTPDPWAESPRTKVFKADGPAAAKPQAKASSAGNTVTKARAKKPA